MNEQPDQNQQQPDEQQLSRKQSRELKKIQKEKEREQHRVVVEQKKKTKKIFTYGIIILIIGGFGYFIYYLSSNKVQPYTPGPVHWHAEVITELCGRRVDLLDGTRRSGMVGPMLTHTHGDNKIHIEGQIFKKEDIALGKFMSGIGAPFSNTTIKDATNGDVCENTGKPGTVQMLVNDVPNEQYREYIPKDGDVIKIVFG